MPRVPVLAAITIAFSALPARAQTVGDSLTSVVEKLFVAMRASDTSATRSAFVSTARVIPVNAGAPANPSSPGLSLDQFVAFVGHNAPGVWIERIFSPAKRVSGPLADLWFEYDVYRGASFDHCGSNSVQMQRTAEGWKIFTMAFTSAAQGCPSRPAP
jgi:hypothetical protein